MPNTDESLYFPDPETSDAQGLLFIGGDLSTQRILQAYSQGIFPWYGPGSPILWWSPNPRLILTPTEFKLSRSLKKSLNKPFKLSIDTVFEQVISSCATCSQRKENTWINQDMMDAYIQLHHMGYAHSFEIWLKNELVGGLYGLSLGKAFFGESMFHRVADASKIAFYYLCQTLTTWEFDFIDCQIPSEHLQRLGSKIISRQDFLRNLNESLKHPTQRGIWTSNKF